jgi:hypothetical protein
MSPFDDYAFEADGPVGRYWLVHGVGFDVCRGDGRQLGVVEEVVVDSMRQWAAYLIVRRHGLFRRYARIDARSVEAVDPASQRFLLEPAPRRPPRVGGAVRRRAAASRALAGRLVLGIAAGLVVAGRALARVLGEVAILVAVVVAAVWRQLAGQPPRQPTAPATDALEQRGDADADTPLAREATSQERVESARPRAPQSNE